MRRTARISTNRILLFGWLALAGACVQTPPPPPHPPPLPRTNEVSPELRQELTRLMDESAAAWNRGDLDAFLATYKDDARTAFMAPQITYGIPAIKARYARTYFKEGRPKAQLSFGDLKFRPLGEDYVLMTGRWYLVDADAKQQEGYYTLIWEQTPDGWKMIHDHSS
ncbi:MAG: YybH family protein [Gemmatimonadota bacterium]